jgi:hypothetical protein
MIGAQGMRHVLGTFHAACFVAIHGVLTFRSVGVGRWRALRGVGCWATRSVGGGGRTELNGAGRCLARAVCHHYIRHSGSGRREPVRTWRSPITRVDLGLSCRSADRQPLSPVASRTRACRASLRVRATERHRVRAQRDGLDPFALADKCVGWARRRRTSPITGRGRTPAGSPTGRYSCLVRG